MPALGLKQSRHPAIAVAAIIAGKTHHRFGQGLLIVTLNLMASLDRTVLSQDPTGKPFRDTDPLLDMDNTAPAALGA
jgi:hypothetical protein